MGEERDPAVRIVDYDPGYVEPLEAIGYLFVPFATAPEYHFFGKPPERPRTHHLHVCEAGSVEELRHLAVRDLLRADPAEAARYEAVKRESARLHPRGPPRLHGRQGGLRRRSRSAGARMGQILTFSIHLQQRCDDNSQLPLRKSP